MNKRLTWKEIKEQYPDKWVGLIDVKYKNNDNITIESAVVKYTDKTKTELIYMSLAGEIVAKYTTPDNTLQLGVVGVFG